MRGAYNTTITNISTPIPIYATRFISCAPFVVWREKFTVSSPRMMIHRAVFTTWDTRNKVCFRRDVAKRMISIMGRIRQAEQIVMRRIAPL